MAVFFDYTFFENVASAKVLRAKPECTSVEINICRISNEVPKMQVKIHQMQNSRLHYK
jgi:hypothetical protein